MFSIAKRDAGWWAQMNLLCRPGTRQSTLQEGSF